MHLDIEQFFDLAEFAVNYALEQGAKWAEARLQRDYSRDIFMRNGNIDAIGFSDEFGIGIRVLVNGSLSFASTDKLDKETIKTTVKQAIKMARAFKGDVKLSEEKMWEDRIIIRPKKDPFDISEGDKISFMKQIDTIALDIFKTKKMQSIRTIGLSWWRTEKYYVNSDGAKIFQVIPRIHIFVRLVGLHMGQAEDISFSLGNAAGWEKTESKEWRILERAQEHAEAIIKILTEAKKCPEGKMDVVLGPSVSGLAAHEAAGHGYEADRIWGREGAQAGESWIRPDFIGKKVANDVVTVIDDPTLPESYGFYLYDDEGVKARPRYLIKNGVINEFLHNRESAARFGTKSTAAARASAYNREPIPRMANTFWAPGDYTFEELIEDIKFGIYIKSFGEWNIDDRRYNSIFVSKEAYLIVNGELKEPIKYAVFEITTPALYQSIDAMSKHLEFEAATCGKGDPGQGVPVFTGGPHLRLRKIVIKCR